MIPSILSGRRRRAPSTLRSSVVFLLLASVACTSGGPSPGVPPRVKPVASASAETDAVAENKEGGMGTRAKGEEAANGRDAVAGPKDKAAEKMPVSAPAPLSAASPSG